MSTTLKPALPERQSDAKPRKRDSRDFIRHASEVAQFYGFRPIRELQREAARLDRKGARKAMRTYAFPDAARVGMECVAGRPESAVLGFYATPTPTHLPHILVPRETAEFGLQVVGSSESVGEILVLKTVAAIIEEWGARVGRIRINCPGDKDSQQRFMRELSLYVRRRMHEFDDDCRTHLMQNPLRLYACANESCRGVLEEGPRPMTFLTEKSRSHFRQLLEHMELLSIPYELDDLLVGDEREPRVVFAFDIENEDGILSAGMGGRFDEYVRKAMGRKEGAAVHASIFFRKKGTDRSSFGSPVQPPQPKVYFVQLGLRAKLQGLAVIDLLRRMGIPLSQTFDTNHLTHQLQQAQATGVTHILLMGQREALDGTIVLRSARNSSQTIIPMSQLPKFLRTLKN